MGTGTSPLLDWNITAALCNVPSSFQPRPRPRGGPSGQPVSEANVPGWAKIDWGVL